jgi:transcriptional regulator with XRE-family HTH domain
VGDGKHPVVAALEWIVANRPATASGRKMSQSALSEESGNSRSYVNHIIRGISGPDIGSEVAIGIARQGNVRVSWLLTGNGPREPFFEGEDVREIDFDLRYPNFGEALKLLTGKLLDETIDAARRTALDADVDLSVSEWMSTLMALDGGLRRKRKTGEEIGTAVEEDNVPPRGRR